MALYREWTLKPHHRRGCMLPVRIIDSFSYAHDAGYASVYMFSKQDAEEIIATQSSAGLSRYAVYADTLTLDLDKGIEQLVIVQAKLQGLAYTVYESGGKGYHVVIPLAETLYGTNVPYSQRKWVEILDVGADLSLYQAGHIISLPGRLHPKTGKRKTLIDNQLGHLLSIPLVTREPPTFAIREDNTSEFERGIWRVLDLLRGGPGPGGRHTALWSTAKHFADSGLEYSTTLDLLWQVNQGWDEPKTLDEVKVAVGQAYHAPTT